eukprot:c2467_g1_i1.p1 GENE.c2467_g1_i1~~c2467_g1_i1.p1  ORF type:complete len:321 (-),score=93.91 c2467_g1_i1:504-1343(-)
MSVAVQKHFDELKQTQEERNQLMQQQEIEIRAVLVKYDQIQEPLWSKREEIIKQIPNFWLKSLNNHPEIAETINKTDEKALVALQNITSRSLSDSKGFALNFHFGDNEFFSNNVLTKVFHFSSNSERVDKVVGCDIAWKQGKNLTIKEVKKRKGKGTKAKVVKKQEACGSFFRFFSTPTREELLADTKDNLDLSDEDMGHILDALVQADFELGLMIQDMTYDSISWYTGEAAAKVLFEKIHQNVKATFVSRTQSWMRCPFSSLVELGPRQKKRKCKSTL